MDLKELKCDLCRMTFDDKKLFEDHKNGMKHQKNLKKVAAKDKKQACGVYVTGKFALFYISFKYVKVFVCFKPLLLYICFL